MVFHNISTTGQNGSGTGETAGEGISGYIPKEPTEPTSVPPHDPAQPIAQCPQDPRIGCETSPQAQIVFNLVSALFGTIKRAVEDVPPPDGTT